MKGYFRALVPHVAHVVDPQRFRSEILRATEDMVENEDPEVTNLEAFRTSFFAHTGLRRSPGSGRCSTRFMKLRLRICGI